KASGLAHKTGPDPSYKGFLCRACRLYPPESEGIIRGAVKGFPTVPSDRCGGLTDVEGIKVGHFTDPRRPTGCTVVLCEKGAVAGVDVRGGAPGTAQTDILAPENTAQQVHAVALYVGSVFGLEEGSGMLSDYH